MLGQMFSQTGFKIQSLSGNQIAALKDRFNFYPPNLHLGLAWFDLSKRRDRRSSAIWLFQKWNVAWRSKTLRLDTVNALTSGCSDWFLILDWNAVSAVMRGACWNRLFGHGARSRRVRYLLLVITTKLEWNVDCLLSLLNRNNFPKRGEQKGLLLYRCSNVTYNEISNH